MCSMKHNMRSILALSAAIVVIAASMLLALGSVASDRLPFAAGNSVVSGSGTAQPSWDAVD